MKYLKQFAMLFFCCVIGDILSVIMQGKLPGNVLGLAFLIVMLISGAFKTSQLDSASNFLLQNMSILFIPSCLQIFEIYADIKNEIIPILIICIATTFLTAFSVAVTVHIVYKLQHRQAKEAKHHG